LYLSAKDRIALGFSGILSPVLPQNLVPQNSSLSPARALPGVPITLASLLVPYKKLVTAMWDFQEQQRQSNMAAGDIIEVTDDGDQDWWYGINKRNGQSGYFPVLFVGVTENNSV
jgi:hypothetical protein